MRQLGAGGVMGSRDRTERNMRQQAEGAADRDAGLPLYPVPIKYRSETAKAAWATGWQMRDHELSKQVPANDQHERPAKA